MIITKNNNKNKKINKRTKITEKGRQGLVAFSENWQAMYSLSLQISWTYVNMHKLINQGDPYEDKDDPISMESPNNTKSPYVKIRGLCMEAPKHKVYHEFETCAPSKRRGLKLGCQNSERIQIAALKKISLVRFHFY